MQKKFIGMLLSVLLLVGCVDSMFSGTVVEKTYIPAKQWMVLLPLVMGENFTALFPFYFHQPEQWALTVESKVDGVTKKRTLYVPKDTYDRLDVGQPYQQRSADSTELIIEKRRATSEEAKRFKTSG